MITLFHVKLTFCCRAAAKRKRTESPAVSQQKPQPAQPQAPQQSTSTHTLNVKKEKDSTHPPPAKRPQMAQHLAESLRSLSPAIEITPLVTFEVSFSFIKILYHSSLHELS
jgi:hypothetical protein